MIVIVSAVTAIVISRFAAGVFADLRLILLAAVYYGAQYGGTTAASLMASGGVPRFVISRILNHSAEKDITSVYDRYSYDAEKKAAMDFWNRQLSAILRGKSASTAGRFNTRLAG